MIFFKTRLFLFIGFFSIVYSSVVSADVLGDNIESLTQKSGFSRPISTTLGTLLNLGFYQSARVGEKIGFYVGVPIMLAYRNRNDLFYTHIEPTNCKEAREANPNSSCYPDELKYKKVPTVIGPSKTAIHYLKINVDENGQPVDTSAVAAGGGLEFFEDRSTYPFLIPQMSISYHFTELTLRFVPIPFDKYSGNVFGFSVQHDFSSFLGSWDDKIAVDISMGVHASFWKMDCKIDDYEGLLKFNGTAWGLSLLMGKRLGPVEVFGEAAYSHSILKMGGLLQKISEPDDAPIKPDIRLKGGNNIKFGVNIAFHLGWYGSFGGYHGAQLGNLINFLSYKQEY